MSVLSIALKKQYREIRRLKKCPIMVFEGLGRKLVCFVTYLIDSSADLEEIYKSTDRELKEGYFGKVEDFDSRYTADIEFDGSYRGRKGEKYRQKTRSNLIELGRSWRKRLSEEFQDTDVTIVVHKEDGTWVLDTFNYPVRIDGAIYL